MSNKIMKPLSLAVGVAFVGSLAIAQAASASSFSLVDMDAGYQLAGNPATDKAKDGTCGEGKCGADKAKHEGHCGEGKCGGKMFDAMDANKDGAVSRAECDAHHDAMFKKMDANSDGSITRAESDAAMKAMHEGKCGEAKCGANKAKEGACGADKAKEGACGADKGKEGACGADKGKKEGSCGGSL